MQAKQLFKNRAATQQAEGNGEPGQETIITAQESITLGLYRQVIKKILPYAATFQKSLFLDKLIVLGEGGLYDL